MSVRRAIHVLIAVALAGAAVTGCADRSFDATAATAPVTTQTAGLPLPGYIENEDGTVEVTGRLLYRADGDYFVLVDAQPVGPLVGSERPVAVLVLEEGDRHGGDLQPLVNSYMQFDGAPIERIEAAPDVPAFVPQTMRILSDGVTVR